MLKRIFSYCLLILLTMQAALAGVDVHTLHAESAAIDISHHYVDFHHQQLSCEEINTDNTQESQHNPEATVSHTQEYSQPHTQDNHHGCSGHVASMIWQGFINLQAHICPVKDRFSYSADFYSIIPLPSFRPPILA